jgi:hypothetical protein
LEEGNLENRLVWKKETANARRDNAKTNKKKKEEEEGERELYWGSKHLQMAELTDTQFRILGFDKIITLFFRERERDC